MSVSDFDPSAYPESVRAFIQKPHPSSNSLIVYRPEAFDGTLTLSDTEGVIVKQSTFDITQLLSTDHYSGMRSLILNGDGTVSYSTNNNLGFRVGYFKTDDLADERTSASVNGTGDYTAINEQGVRDKIIAPMPGLVVNNALAPGGRGYRTDENGAFYTYTDMPICPNFSINMSVPISVEVPYRAYNPLDSETIRNYYFWQEYPYHCSGWAFTSLTSLVEAAAQINVIGTIAGTAYAPAKLSVPVDVTMLTGSFVLRNAQNASPVEAVKGSDENGNEINQTIRLSALAEQPDYVLPSAPDFNFDGVEDHVSELGSFASSGGDDAAPRYGVWFSLPDEPHLDDQGIPHTASEAEGGEAIAPDLIRVATRPQTFDDIGLLQQITYEDLAQTDIYVFRESTGDLVMEKAPFYNKDAEVQGMAFGNLLNGVSDAGKTAFEISIPGRSASFSSRFRFSVGSDAVASELADNGNIYYNAWQATQFVEKDFRGQTDSLRVGEPVLVVLINRATGYVGTARTYIHNTNASQIGVSLGEVSLYPPNLKVRVERQYEVEQGLTQGQTRHYQVGSEGAALHSDQYIKVTTDWRDYDGRPLPSQLKGFTGRLASLVEDSQLESRVDHFEIKPGLNTELLILPNALAAGTTAHQYLHVVADSAVDTADFSASDASFNRPDAFVPVRVAVYDEEQSRALKLAQLENSDLTGQNSSVYQWPWRPEMMYSVYDLKVSEITRTDTEGTETDLTDNETPVLTSEDQLKIVQDLIASEYDPLDYFGADSDLIYSLEEYQQQVSTGDDTEYTYDDLGYLNDLNGDDYLTLNLLNSQDQGNVLWEWAFGSCYLVADKTEISADLAQVSLVMQCTGREDQRGKEVKVHWRVKGSSGAQFTSLESVSTDRVFTNTLNTSRHAGNTYFVIARVVDSDDESVLVGNLAELSSPIVVAPGRPFSASMTGADTELLADGVSSATIGVYFKDSYSNPVAEGTAVNWDVHGDGSLSSSTTQTDANGFTELAYTAGFDLMPSEIEARSGRAAAEVAVAKQSLDGELTTERSEVYIGQNDSVTLVFASSGVPDGTVIDWFSSRGAIVPTASTVENGLATAILHASESVGEGLVSATVGAHRSSLVVQHILPYDEATAPLSLTAESAVIVGANGPGSVSIETVRDGALQNVDYSYEAATNLLLDASQNWASSANPSVTLETAVRVSLGTPHQPNVAPQRDYDFSQIESGAISELNNETGLNVIGDVSVDRTASTTLPGSSLLFTNGRLEGSLPLWDSLEGVGLSVSLLPQITSSTSLLTIRDATGPRLTLVINESGGFEGRLYTPTGEIITIPVGTSIPVKNGSWRRVGLRVYEGQLQLQVDDRMPVQSLAGINLSLTGELTVIVGDGFQGNLDDLKIYREQDSNQLIRLESDDPLYVNADGKASARISATGVLPLLGARVGFSYSYDRENNALQDHAYVAQTDIAVVNPESWGWAMEFAGRGVFGDQLDNVKSAAQLVYSVSGISDVVTIVGATWKATTGRIAEVDGFETGFAVVGFATSVVSAILTGPPGLLTIKSSLLSLKELLKELFIEGALDLVRSAVAVAKFVFSSMKEFITNPSGALENLSHFGVGLLDMIQGTPELIRSFFIQVRSVDSLSDWLAIRRIDKACITTGGLDPAAQNWASAPQRVERSFNAELLLDILFPKAYAANCFSRQARLEAGRQRIIDEHVGDPKVATTAARTAYNAAQRVVIRFEELGMTLSEESVDTLVRIAYKGGADTVDRFADHASALSTSWRGAHTNAMAAYLRVIAKVPESVGGFDAWIRRLGDSQERIKGLYGEAAHLDELLSSENLRLADGSIADGVTMNLDVRTEIPIDNVDGKPVRVGSESLDIYIADRRDNPVRVIMSESKVRASNYDEGLKGIKRQFIKHIDAEVMREIEGGNIPKLYYRLQGGAYVGKDPGEISQVMMEYLEEKRPQVFERLVDTEGFIFNADSVAIVSEKLNPFVN